MPLLGDATIGLAAVVVAVLLWRRASLAVWTGAMIWTALGAFDALAAYVVERQSPWPEFFMLELVGRPMFFAAAAMHVAIGYLLTRPDVLSHFGMADGEDVASSLVSTRERASR